MSFCFLDYIEEETKLVENDNYYTFNDLDVFKKVLVEAFKNMINDLKSKVNKEEYISILSNNDYYEFVMDEKIDSNLMLEKYDIFLDYFTAPSYYDKETDKYFGEDYFTIVKLPTKMLINNSELKR